MVQQKVKVKSHNRMTEYLVRIRSQRVGGPARAKLAAVGLFIGLLPYIRAQYRTAAWLAQ
jgi:hypothetical protein